MTDRKLARVFTAEELEHVKPCDAESQWCEECRILRAVIAQAAAQARVIEKLKALPERYYQGASVLAKGDIELNSAIVTAEWLTGVRAALALLDEEGL